jgi:hypothetical protein
LLSRERTAETLSETYSVAEIPEASRSSRHLPSRAKTPDARLHVPSPTATRPHAKNALIILLSAATSPENGNPIYAQPMQVNRCQVQLCW